MEDDNGDEEQRERNRTSVSSLTIRQVCCRTCAEDDFVKPDSADNEEDVVESTTNQPTNQRTTTWNMALDSATLGPATGPTAKAAAQEPAGEGPEENHMKP